MSLPQSARSGTPTLARSTELLPLGLRLRTFASEQLRLANLNLAREGEDWHDGIHEARKCMRRARATLALGRRVSGRAGELLDDELGRLTRGLSRLRDAQALIEVLQRLAVKAPPEVQLMLPGAEHAARLRRDQLLSIALLRDPGMSARRRRLQSVQKRLQKLDWQAVDAAVVTVAIARTKRRAEKAYRRASGHPDNGAAWHLYRRRLRRLHQQDDLLAELQPELRPRAARRLQNLARKLGVSQDDALLLEHCGRRSPFSSSPRKLLRELARQRLQRMRAR